MSESEVYDPTAPEGAGGGGGHYLSKKDLKVLAGGLVCLAIMLWPVYSYMKRNSEKARCVQNMKAIGEALNLYAGEHDERYPPVYRTDDHGNPSLGETGLAYTWADDISKYMSTRRASFVCPSALPEEIGHIEGWDSPTPIAISYGMYVPYSTFLTSLVENPDQQVIVAETSNVGSAGTYDPLPYKDMSDNVQPNDCFAIAWDNGNLVPSADTKAVTRLAFGGSKNGAFSKTGESRHPSGINFLTASGAKKYWGPEIANVRIKAQLPSDHWAVPALKSSIRQ